MSSRLFPDDPLILNYTRQKQALISYINDQIVLRLEGEIDIANSKLEALERPRDVIMKHREFTQEALRDEKTLVSLQNQLNQIRLEQARSPEPWELISLPRLLNKPVSPIKERVLGVGLIPQGFNWSSYSFMEEKR